MQRGASCKRRRTTSGSTWRVRSGLNRKMTSRYVHGYSELESTRLVDQATTLTDLLHHDTAYPAGSVVLEAGCGVGAQTVTLARQSPGARIVAVDISKESLALARERVASSGADNVEFHHADLMELPFPPGSFDHVFLCFVLEHLAEPEAVLRALLRMLRPGGTLTAIEGDHGSAYFHPDHAGARRSIECLVDLQRRHGGDALIGRRLFPLLTSVGVDDVRVSPRMVYADGSRPALQDGFTRKTFAAMVEGVESPAVAAGMMAPQAFREAALALRRAAEPDGVFCYTFFKAVGLKPVA